MNDLPLFDPYKALEEIRRNAAREGLNAPPQKLPQKLPQAPAEEITYIDHEVRPASATSATSAGGPSAHAASHARVKERKEKKNIYISTTYARCGAEHVDPAVCGREGPAEVAEVLLSHSDKRGTNENEVAEVFGPTLRKWRSCLSELSPDRIPCPDYRAEEWRRVHARAFSFLDQFGPQALALGWTAPRLFGVHREAGIVRVDACGALVLPTSGPVRAITATEISFGHLTYREKPRQPAGVPWWEFGR